MDELDGAGRWYEVFADFARRYGVDKTMELMAPEIPAQRAGDAEAAVGGRGRRPGTQA
ncbi:hypothetical protein Kisp01_69060 [Kineosporia sp. NBRC 101677]|uniref:hypothetical protein n=1 Tax=Kineosporia sp. NBRC 101677 TaxID=3032197 RepID=UPI0024A36B84|nr:hypothetical protein [Kineosporia sp. NBRC 101677]GLY19892.1 hypothetical protein Kisp01_69060 [Kineosporia sp. NBRC 101677]